MILSLSGPVCSRGLISSNVYHVSFALEEAVRVFRLINTSEQASQVAKTLDKILHKKQVDPFRGEYERRLLELEKQLDQMDFSSKNRKKKR